MVAAYELLGLRSHHTLMDMGDLRQWELLKQAAESKWPSAPGARPRLPFTPQDWDRIFGSYDAITDDGASSVEELAAAYPGAKVVVVERDFERWWRNFEAELVNRLLTPSAIVANWISHRLLGSSVGAAVRRRSSRALGARDTREVRAKVREHYPGYYDNVRRVIPPNRRLEYHLGSGWEPLCQFLGKEIPDTEIPRVNEAEAHAERTDAFTRELAMKTWHTV
ncbi:hypothetical protein DL769_007300 [Monosporascus sp. CRB-8-3]|nr:hypothetical protein DL769_007300 [Monosporascus sp. CRB-8-3]